MKAPGHPDQEGGEEEEEEEEEEGKVASGENPEASGDDEDLTALCGLVNIGNTCYLNSGVQLLVTCSAFLVMLEKRRVESWTSLIRPNQNTTRQRLLNGWRLLVRSMQSGSNALNPHRFVEEVMRTHHQFIGFGQQDAHEFVATLLAAFDDELRDPFHIPAVLRSLERCTASDSSSIPASSPTLPPASSPHTRRVPRDILLLRFMDNLFNENIRLDQLCSDREARRKGKGISFTSGAYYPRVYRSKVSDLFQGRTVSIVACRGCQRQSLRVEPFTCLTLEVPSTAQRQALEEQMKALDEEQLEDSNEPHVPTIYNTRSRLNLFGLASNAFSWMAGAVSSFVPYSRSYGTLTLDECLRVHCMQEHVSGSNCYSCPHCDSLQEASKCLRFLELPEYLIINFKRFSHSGYWSSKINDYIEFPLDWSPDDDDEAPEFLDLADLCYATEELPIPDVTTYTLQGVVSHFGSYMGGHYVSYAFKEAYGKWVYCNDDLILRTDREKVAGANAYILLYKKQSRTVDERMQWLAARAKLYLRETKETHETLRAELKNKGLGICYISRNWLVKLAYCAEPGVICNEPWYPFDEEEESKEPVVRISAREFYVPISEKDWGYFVEQFGGGPKVDEEAYALLLEREEPVVARAAAAHQRSL